MNIVILAGGTGSIALQKGIHSCLGSNVDGLSVKVLTNAYDNGLSTGAVRKVCGGKILGPSDVRKNQTTRLKLIDPSSPWIRFLDTRFTCLASDAKHYCYNAIDVLEQELRKSKHHATDHVFTVKDAVDYFFSAPDALNIDYSDFSLANIIYAGLARGYGNSLRDAAQQMAFLMGIEDNVILNSDESLFLGAVTKSGKRITDEGDIVSWGDVNDPFVDIFFTDAHGKQTTPTLCKEAENTLREADLIILSTGTQWSSLIPTYASLYFKEVIDSCTAPVIMVMNKTPDQDSPGQTAGEIIDALVPRYFSPGKLAVVAAHDYHSTMLDFGDSISKLKSLNLFPSLSDTLNPQIHSHVKLFNAIAQTYFGKALDSEYYFFDYDDTLVARGNKLPNTSNTNISLIKQLANSGVKVGICTGNSAKAVNLKLQLAESVKYGLPPDAHLIDIFADGGINHYTAPVHLQTPTTKPLVFGKCLAPELLFVNNGKNVSGAVITMLTDAGINATKIENRGDAVISIKPVDNEYRDMMVNLIDRIFAETDLSVVVNKAGRTTVEMHHPNVSKRFAVEHVLNQIKDDAVTFIGDEFANGNDKVVGEMAKTDNRLVCVPVNSPIKTAFFLITKARSINIING